MSKALKVIVGVVASIAIPFVAPYIAGALGASTAVASALGVSAATGAAVAGGLTGAALGAANAALTGGKIGRGALFGALGGGVGGFNNPMAGIKGATAAAGTTAAGTAGTLTEPAGSVVQGAGGAGGSLSGAGAAGSTTGAAAGGTTAAAAPGFIQNVTSGFKQAVGSVFSPENISQAGLQLGASALAGSGMSAEERRALAAQQSEAQRLTDMGRASDQLRFDQATQMLNDARYFDPEYMGLQSARKEQQRGAISKAEALRGMTGDQRVAEERRRDLGIARNVGTAYDVGYGSGVDSQMRARTAGLANLPGGGTTGLTSMGTLQNSYNLAEERRRKRVEDIGGLFGGFTGKKAATSTGG
jgi:hypothetical protein